MSILTQSSLLLGLLFIIPSCSRQSDAPPIPVTFNKPSDELKATVVVPTLDAPIPNGKNAIWCASFESAWKALQELVGEPITFDPPTDAAKSLNNVTDPRPHIPAASLYVAAGSNPVATINQIATDLKQRFPSKEPPTFQGIVPESFITYAYLEANVKFSRPYDQNKQPLTFVEAGGRRTEVHSFGILSENHDARDKLWHQPRVLFRKGEPHEDSFEFAIDLCTNSSPSQLVIARIDREPTLSAAIARVEREMVEMPQLVEVEAAKSGRYTAERLHTIESTGAMLVPDFHWAMSHRFTQLEGARLANERFKSQVLGVAQQDILFRLDKSGAELKSEAKAYAPGEPTHFFLDRPFLVYMKKRGAEMPYFVMWVDNAELLRLWKTTQSSSPNNESATQ